MHSQESKFPIGPAMLRKRIELNLFRVLAYGTWVSSRGAELYLRPKIDLLTAKARAEPIIAEAR